MSARAAGGPEDERALAEKTELLMNVVVEMRKRNGKACAEYAQKSFIAESQLQKMTIEAISKANFKPKVTVPDINVEELTADFKQFDKELDVYCQKIDNLRRKMKNADSVVTQLKQENLLFRRREPLSKDMFLATAKDKIART